MEDRASPVEAKKLKLSERIEQQLFAIQNEIKEAGYKPALITLKLPRDLYRLLIEEFTNKYRQAYGVEDIDEFTLYGKFVFSKMDE
jgi:hypothetical protein